MSKICTGRFLSGFGLACAMFWASSQPVIAEEPASTAQAPGEPAAAMSVPKQLLRAMASDRMTDADRERFAGKILSEYRNIAVPLIAESIRTDSYGDKGMCKIVDILAQIDTPQSAELMATILAESTGDATITDVEAISDWSGLCKQLLDAAKDDTPSAGRRVSQLLPPTLSTVLTTLANGQNDRRAELDLLKGLNNLMSRRDLYDAESFATVSLPSTIRALFDQNLPATVPAAVIQLNHVLLSAAFPQIPDFEAVSDGGDPLGLAIFTGFAKMRTPEAAEYLVNAITFSSDRTMAHIDALSFSNDNRSNTILARYLCSANKTYSATARKAFVAKATQTDISQALSTALSSDDTIGLFEHVTSNFLQACLATESESLIAEAFVKLLGGMPVSRRTAIDVLEKFPAVLNREPVRTALKSTMEAEMLLSTTASNKSDQINSARALIKSLNALLKCNAPEAIDIVAVALDSKNKEVRGRVCEVLEALSGEHIGYSPQNWKRWMEKRAEEK